jgi:hypothetical protein
MYFHLGNAGGASTLLSLPIYEGNPRTLILGYQNHVNEIERVGPGAEYNGPRITEPSVPEHVLQSISEYEQRVKAGSILFGGSTFPPDTYSEVRYTQETPEGVWDYLITHWGMCGEDHFCPVWRFRGWNPALIDKVNREGIANMFTMQARGLVRNQLTPNWSWIQTLPAEYLPYAESIAAQWDSVILPAEVELARGDSRAESFFQTPVGKLWMVTAGVLAGGALAAAFAPAGVVIGAKAGAVGGGLVPTDAVSAGLPEVGAGTVLAPTSVMPDPYTGLLPVGVEAPVGYGTVLAPGAISIPTDPWTLAPDFAGPIGKLVGSEVIKKILPQSTGSGLPTTSDPGYVEQVESRQIATADMFGGDGLKMFLGFSIGFYLLKSLVKGKLA